MALVVSALVINWAMISLAHMMFRRAKQQQGVKTRFPALFYPFGNVLCLLFMAAVLIIMLMTPYGDLRVADSGMAAYHGRRLSV